MLISAPVRSIRSTAAATIRCDASSSSAGGLPPHPRLRATSRFLEPSPGEGPTVTRPTSVEVVRNGLPRADGTPIIHLTHFVYGHADRGLPALPRSSRPCPETGP